MRVRWRASLRSSAKPIDPSREPRSPVALDLLDGPVKARPPREGHRLGENTEALQRVGSISMRFCDSGFELSDSDCVKKLDLNIIKAVTEGYAPALSPFAESAPVPSRTPFPPGDLSAVSRWPHKPSWLPAAEQRCGDLGGKPRCVQPFDRRVCLFFSAH